MSCLRWAKCKKEAIQSLRISKEKNTPNSWLYSTGIINKLMFVDHVFILQWRLAFRDGSFYFVRIMEVNVLVRIPAHLFILLHLWNGNPIQTRHLIKPLRDFSGIWAFALTLKNIYKTQYISTHAKQLTSLHSTEKILSVMFNPTAYLRI